MFLYQILLPSNTALLFGISSAPKLRDSSVVDAAADDRI